MNTQPFSIDEIDTTSEMDLSDTIPAAMPQAQPEAEAIYTVRHNGQEYQLDMDNLLVCAQKGMDYDRIRTQRDKLRGGDASDGYLTFFEAHPEITDANQIPQDVIEEIAKGKDLSMAYLSYENQKMRERLEEMEQTNMPLPAPFLNEGDSVGDEFLHGLLGSSR